jgi:signal transduction histidine kinase
MAELPTVKPPYLLIAVSSEERGQGFGAVARDLNLNPLVLTQVEQLLYQTRASVPAAIVLEDSLVAQVAQLDLIALLRRRKPLASVPIVCLGPDHPERHVAAIESGADVYITLPTRAPIVRAYLKQLLARQQAEGALREALARMRTIEQHYQEAERVKEDLIHMLVHDLKSPIASVMGLLDHSIETLQAAGQHDITELLTLARAESQHLLHLAANILDVRRMKDGHMPFNPVWIDNLTELAKVALQDVSGVPRDRQFSFLVRPEAEQFMADAALLRRILANLLANAVKHTRRGGHIDFRAWKQDNAIVLSVRDDGEGIPEADHRRIFNAFEQSRHTIHDRFDTGMGLTFCKLAVEKHGGKIWVESKVGRGSTFFFTIPLSLQTLQEQEEVVFDTATVAP